MESRRGNMVELVAGGAVLESGLLNKNNRGRAAQRGRWDGGGGRDLEKR